MDSPVRQQDVRDGDPGAAGGLERRVFLEASFMTVTARRRVGVVEHDDDPTSTSTIQYVGMPLTA
jgi:hypothetical protein